jgi:hypothetical protein
VRENLLAVLLFLCPFFPFFFLKKNKKSKYGRTCSTRIERIGVCLSCSFYADQRMCNGFFLVYVFW